MIVFIRKRTGGKNGDKIQENQGRFYRLRRRRTRRIFRVESERHTRQTAYRQYKHEQSCIRFIGTIVYGQYGNRITYR